MIRTLLPVALLLLACGHDGAHPLPSFPGLTRVTGASPFAQGCVTAGQAGTNFPAAEVEPFVAIDPRDARHLVGVWQQDRWSNGGSNGLGSGASFDGGKTWATGFAHFSNCSGGNAANRANFQRASDPWVTFGADSTPHQIGFGFDKGDARAAMMAVRSADGGRTWTEPLFLFEETNDDTAIDKESITADPSDPNLVYAIWDRLTGLLLPANSPNATGPAWFTRTTDGGKSWEPARVIFDPGPNAQTLGNVIVVLPSGTLIDVLTIVTQLNQQSQPASVAVLRSTDKGQTWSSKAVTIADETSQGVKDPKNSIGVRTGDIVPAIAVDPQSGALYVAWEDSRFSSGARDGIVLSKSTDEGVNWSAPVRVNGVLATQAFTPSLAVAQGKVGVTYSDLRNDNPADSTHLLATVWLAVSSDGGAHFQESAIGGPFDIRNAPRTADGYFTGDYQGLVASGAGFLPFFVLGNDGDTANRTDVFARPLPASGVAGLSSLPEALLPPALTAGRGLALQQAPRTGLRRVY